MKRIILLIAGLTAFAITYAQAPASFKYQAVARDGSGAVLANKSVSFRISILQGTVTGTIVYSERHNISTNEFGLVNLEIGRGTAGVGSMGSINWGSNPYFIKVEMDPAGGSNFLWLGTTQLLSVPYALHAKTVEDDTWGNQVAMSDATLLGNGTVGNPLRIAQQRALTGNVLKWNGSTWMPAIDNTEADGAEIAYTVLNVNCASVAAFGNTYVKIADIGNFTKLDPGSRLEITFNGRIYAVSVTGTGAKFELRVDDVATSNGRATASYKSAEVGSTGVTVSMTGIFTGLKMGSHTISMWVKTSNGTGTYGGVDPGCWSTDHLIVREIR